MIVPSPLLVLFDHPRDDAARNRAVDDITWLAAQGAEIHVATNAPRIASTVPEDRRHPLKLHTGRLLDPRRVWSLRRLFQRLDPRVVVTHGATETLAARIVAPAVPRVAMAHGWSSTRYPIAARLLDAADAVVAPDQRIARRLLRHGLDPSRLRVVPDGIDTARFEPPNAETLAAARQALGAAPEDVAILNAGRLLAVKRQERILHAAASLARTHPRVRWAFVGTGSQRAALQALAHDLGLLDRVRFLGRRDDLATLMLASDMYVSTADQEGLPLSMMEAMAAGLPVVSTAIEGVDSLVGPETGVLVPVGDAGALSSALGRLADDELLRLRLGAAAHGIARRDFGPEGMHRRLAAVLASVTHPD